jgi:prephenate dehydrogenase
MRRISIIGLGLIGGSMGLALKRAGLKDTEIIGYTRSSATATTALKLGAVDKMEDNLVSTVEKAGIVILATPVMAMKEIMGHIGPHLSTGCVVTDAASTKVKVMEWAEECLPPEIDYIGGHPMAGKELSGSRVAEADLFKGCTYCIVQGESASPEAIGVITDLVKTVGANPLFITASEHDNFVAGISHLPLIISSTLVMSTVKSPHWQDMAILAAGGYRDLSRLASQHPIMNRDICLTNQENILNWTERFMKELSRFRQLIIDGGEELEKAFIQVQQARQKWIDEYDKRN